MASRSAILWGLVFLAGCLQIKAWYQQIQRKPLTQTYMTDDDDDTYVTKEEFDKVCKNFQTQLNLTNRNLQSMADSIAHIEERLDQDVSKTEFYQTNNIIQTEVDSINTDVTELTSSMKTMQDRLNKDPCSAAPCANQGTCNNVLDDYTCICKPGFGGKNCDKETGVSDTIVLTVSNGGIEGIWYPWSVCPPGSFARTFQIRLASPGGDDTAMNNVELYCSNFITGANVVSIQSGPDLWGDWKGWQDCPDGEFLVGFALKVEGDQGNGDDSAANGITMTCSGGETRTGPTGKWGSFGSTSKCPSSHYICGVQIKQEPEQWGGDDSSMNDVAFKCCSWW